MGKKARPWWHYLAVIVVILVIVAYAYPYLSPYIPKGGGQVTLMVNLINGADNTAVTPAGISVKFYHWPAIYGLTIPRANVLPLAPIGPGSETPDGEFTTSATATEGELVYVYVTDSGATFKTTGAIRAVPYVIALGISTEAILDPITVWPCSASGATGYGATSGDVAPLITSGGSARNNASNWLFGENDYRMELAITANKGWGGNTYINPDTGEWYLGGFIVFEYDISVARITHSGGPLYKMVDLGTTRYYIYEVGLAVNDGDISGDGTWMMDFTLNVQVGDTTNALDINFYPGRKADLVNALSFGATDLEKADNLLDIDLATS